MATAYHGEGPVIVTVSQDNLSAKARFNGSLGVIASATGSDAQDTFQNMATALETTVPFGNLLNLVPVIFTKTNDRAPFPV